MRERETIEKRAVDSRNIGAALEQMELLHVCTASRSPLFSIRMEQNAVKKCGMGTSQLNNTNITCSIRAHGTRKMAVEIFSCVYLPGSL